MKEFFRYFFGQGQQQEFSLFTPAHILPIVIMIGVIFLIRWQKERIRNWKYEQAIRYVLAFALIISEMSYYWRLSGVPGLNPNAADHLPIFVCGWVVVFCSFMVIGKTQSLFDISYFWLLSGTVFALLTPTPLQFTGPTRFRYYQFWAEHTLGYIAVFYMIFVHGMRPTIKSAIRSYIALAVLAVIATWVNEMIPGANYLYMARPEAAPSVLDILPPVHWLRVTIMASVITLMFALAYLPWYLKDKKKSKESIAALERTYMKRGLVFILLLALLLTTPVPQVQAQSAQEISAEILDMTEQMQFPADQESVEMRCPVCLQTVTWYALHVDAEINTQATRRLNNLHIYMVGDIVGEDIFDPKTNTGGFMFRTEKTNEHSVIHLNDHTLNASQGVLMVEYGEVSIIGDGEAWGRRNNPDFGSSLDVRNGAQLNIYGGKYYRNSPQPMVKIVEDGTFNLFGGTLEGNDAQENGTIQVEVGTCNIYGGMLESGFSSRVGSNLIVFEEGTANIYGGELMGGRDASGGNICNKGNLNVYGGKISGEIREDGGIETITGGHLDSEITAENAKITGGTFTTDITPFVEAGYKVSVKNGIYTVGEGAGLPWQWLAIGGGALVVLVALIVVLTAAGKKKKKQEV